MTYLVVFLIGIMVERRTEPSVRVERLIQRVLKGRGSVVKNNK